MPDTGASGGSAGSSSDGVPAGTGTGSGSGASSGGADGAAVERECVDKGDCDSGTYCFNGTCTPGRFDGCTPRAEAGCDSCSCEESICTGAIGMQGGATCCSDSWTGDCASACRRAGGCGRDAGVR